MLLPVIVLARSQDHCGQERLVARRDDGDEEDGTKPLQKMGHNRQCQSHPQDPAKVYGLIHTVYAMAHGPNYTPFLCQSSP